MKTVVEFLKSKTLKPKKFEAGKATYTALEVVKLMTEYSEMVVDRCLEEAEIEDVGRTYLRKYQINKNSILNIKNELK